MMADPNHSLRKIKQWPKYLSFALFAVIIAGMAGVILYGFVIKNKTDTRQLQYGASQSDNMPNEIIPNMADIYDQLAPHKALYHIRLSSSKSDSQIVNISGDIYYELAQSCSGWMVTHRFHLLYEYSDAPAIDIKNNFTSFESYDGTTYEFSTTRKRNDIVFEDIRGGIKINEGEDVNAQPQQASLQRWALFKGEDFPPYQLPSDAFFPSAHTLALLQQAKSGDKFFQAPIFDGSDSQGAVLVNAIILGEGLASHPKLQSQPQKISTKSEDVGGRENRKEMEKDSTNMNVPYSNIDSDLLSTHAYKMRLAFFPLHNQAVESDYEMEMNIHDNGVVDHMAIDYGGFSIAQDLVALKGLPRQVDGCNR